MKAGDFIYNVLFQFGIDILAIVVGALIIAIIVWFIFFFVSVILCFFGMDLSGNMFSSGYLITLYYLSGLFIIGLGYFMINNQAYFADILFGFDKISLYQIEVLKFSSGCFVVAIPLFYAISQSDDDDDTELKTKKIRYNKRWEQIN